MAAPGCAVVLLLLLLFVVLVGQASAAARLWSPAGPQRVLQQAPSSEWIVVLNRGIKMNDIDCGPKGSGVAKEGGGRNPSCKVCGGTPAVAAACQENPKCVAFVMDDSKPASFACGFLKSAVSNQEDSKTQALYCSTGRGTKCTGQFRFTPRTGMMFTGDYRCGSINSSLCFQAGGINAVAAACLKYTQCKAFAYNRVDQGGYFKNAEGVASPTSGSDLYQRA